MLNADGKELVTRKKFRQLRGQRTEQSPRGGGGGGIRSKGAGWGLNLNKRGPLFHSSRREEENDGC